MGDLTLISWRLSRIKVHANVLHRGWCRLKIRCIPSLANLSSSLLYWYVLRRASRLEYWAISLLVRLSLLIIFAIVTNAVAEKAEEFIFLNSVVAVHIGSAATTSGYAIYVLLHYSGMLILQGNKWREREPQWHIKFSMEICIVWETLHIKL